MRFVLCQFMTLRVHFVCNLMSFDLYYLLPRMASHRDYNAMSSPDIIVEGPTLVQLPYVTVCVVWCDLFSDFITLKLLNFSMIK